jgi:hypothetical protein
MISVAFNNKQAIPMISIALILVSLLLLASGLSSIRFRAPLRLEESDVQLRTDLAMGEAPFLNQLFILTMIIVWIMVIYAMINPDIRTRVLQRVAQYILLASLLIGAALLWNWLVGSDDEVDQMIVSPPAAAERSYTFVNIPAYDDEALPSPPGDLPPWLRYLFSLAISVSAIGTGWYLWYKRQQPGLSDLAETARSSALELEAGGELQDVILRCYAQMLDVLKRQRGIRRKEAMTPAEFATWLKAAGLPDRPVTRLTRLFERARYGGISAGQAEAMEAIDCLNAIANACERQPS